MALPRGILLLKLSRCAVHFGGQMLEAAGAEQEYDSKGDGDTEADFYAAE